MSNQSKFLTTLILLFMCAQLQGQVDSMKPAADKPSAPDSSLEKQNIEGNSKEKKENEQEGSPSEKSKKELRKEMREKEKAEEAKRNRDFDIPEEQRISFSFSEPFPVKSYREILDGSNAQIIITDINKLIYKCEYTESQKSYREEQTAGVPTVLESRTNDLPTLTITRKGNSLDPSSINGKQTEFQEFKDSITVLNDTITKIADLLNTLSARLESYELALEDTNAIKRGIYFDGALVKERDPILIAQNVTEGRVNSLQQELDVHNSNLSLIRDELSKISDIAGRIELSWSEFLSLSYVINEFITLHNDLKNEILKTNSKIDVQRNFKYRKMDFYSENSFPTNQTLGSIVRGTSYKLRMIENELDRIKNSADYTESVHGQSLNELDNNISSLRGELLQQANSAVRGIEEMSQWILKDSNFRCVFTSSMLRNDVDAMTIDIKVSPKEQLTGIHLNSIDETVEFRARRGIKIDFSAGLALNAGFIDDFSILEDDYELTADSDTTTLLKATDNEDVLSPAAIAMANIYIRRPGNLNFGLSAGAGTDLSSISYYFGGSLLMGREDVLVFTAGVALAERKELKSEYRTALNDNEGILDVPVGSLDEASLYSDRDPFRMGLFFGLTYNFTAKKEKQWKENFARD